MIQLEWSNQNPTGALICMIQKLTLSVCPTSLVRSSGINGKLSNVRYIKILKQTKN